MRIATSTMYSQQAASMDNLETQYQNQGLTLSTGKVLNAPSDNPTLIGEDLNVRSTITVENQQTTNIQAATAQLTTTDSALANLTSVLQSVRELANRGASSFLSASDRKNIGDQVDQYLTQAVAIANTQYGNTYLFAGSVQSSTAPVSTTGSPTSAVAFSGNEQAQTPLTFNGQTFALSPSLQQAFNYSATDGSPSVFDTLVSLRDTLDNGTVVDQSSQSLNRAGQVIYGNASPVALQTTLASVATTPFATVPTPDSTGNFTITVNDTDANGVNHVKTYTFPATTAVDGGPTSVTGEINAANTGANPTGLTARFNAQTQKLVLSSSGGGPFTVTDEPSPGATGTSNFTTLFALAGSASLPQTVSTQLVDIDHVLDTTLNARALIGSRINALAQIKTQVSTDVLDNTSVQSGIEDTDVAKMTTQFSATQTALTASYSVTSRLEAKDLFDYL